MRCNITPVRHNAPLATLPYWNPSGIMDNSLCKCRFERGGVRTNGAIEGELVPPFLSMRKSQATTTRKTVGEKEQAP